MTDRHNYVHYNTVRDYPQSFKASEKSNNSGSLKRRLNIFSRKKNKTNSNDATIRDPYGNEFGDKFGSLSAASTARNCVGKSPTSKPSYPHQDVKFASVRNVRSRPRVVVYPWETYVNIQDPIHEDDLEEKVPPTTTASRVAHCKCGLAVRSSTCSRGSRFSCRCWSPHASQNTFQVPQVLPRRKSILPEKVDLYAVSEENGDNEQHGNGLHSRHEKVSGSRKLKQNNLPKPSSHSPHVSFIKSIDRKGPFNSVASRKSILECDVTAYDLIKEHVDSSSTPEIDSDADDDLNDNAIELKTNKKHDTERRSRETRMSKSFPNNKVLTYLSSQSGHANDFITYNEDVIRGQGPEDCKTFRVSTESFLPPSSPQPSTKSSSSFVDSNYNSWSDRCTPESSSSSIPDPDYEDDTQSNELSYLSNRLKNFTVSYLSPSKQKFREKPDVEKNTFQENTHIFPSSSLPNLTDKQFPTLVAPHKSFDSEHTYPNERSTSERDLFYQHQSLFSSSSAALEDKRLVSSFTKPIEKQCSSLFLKHSGKQCSYSLSQPVDKQRSYSLSQPVDKQRSSSHSQPVDQQRFSSFEQPADKQRFFSLSQLVDKQRFFSLSQSVDKQPPCSFAQPLSDQGSYSFTKPTEDQGFSLFAQFEEEHCPLFLQAADKRPISCSQAGENQHPSITRTTENQPNSPFLEHAESKRPSSNNSSWRNENLETLTAVPVCSHQQYSEFDDIETSIDSSDTSSLSQNSSKEVKSILKRNGNSLVSVSSFDDSYLPECEENKEVRKKKQVKFKADDNDVVILEHICPMSEWENDEEEEDTKEPRVVQVTPVTQENQNNSHKSKFKIDDHFSSGFQSVGEILSSSCLGSTAGQRIKNEKHDRMAAEHSGKSLVKTDKRQHTPKEDISCKGRNKTSIPNHSQRNFTEVSAEKYKSPPPGDVTYSNAAASSCDVVMDRDKSSSIFPKNGHSSPATKKRGKVTSESTPEDVSPDVASIQPPSSLSIVESTKPLVINNKIISESVDEAYPNWSLKINREEDDHCKSLKTGNENKKTFSVSVKTPSVCNSTKSEESQEKTLEKEISKYFDDKEVSFPKVKCPSVTSIIIKSSPPNNKFESSSVINDSVSSFNCYESIPNPTAKPEIPNFILGGSPMSTDDSKVSNSTSSAFYVSVNSNQDTIHRKRLVSSETELATKKSINIVEDQDEEEEECSNSSFKISPYYGAVTVKISNSGLYSDDTSTMDDGIHRTFTEFAEEEPVYEEIDNYDEPLPSLHAFEPSKKSFFEGASKADILHYLEDAKERGFEQMMEEDIDILVEEEEENDEEEGINQSKPQERNHRVRISNASSSSQSSSGSVDSSSPGNKDVSKLGRPASAEIERTDSGVGAETSKPSKLRRLVAIENEEQQCADCDQQVEPREDEFSGTMFNPLVCRKCEKKQYERKELISEIVVTELKYGRDLRIIKEEFYRPMEVAGLLGKEQLRQIFLNIDELISFNSIFAEKLKDAIDIAREQGDEDYTTVNIGKLFLDSTAMLHAFETYCVQQGPSSMLLHNLEKEKELLRIFLRVSQMENIILRRMNLSSFLMVPVQRVTKYPLLLTRLYKVTPFHHGDRETIKEAKQKVELHLEHINEQTKGVGETKIWRRISNISSSNRRLSNGDDIGNIKLRKMALEVLQWNRDEVRFVMAGKLHFYPMADMPWNKKGKPQKFTTVHALLVTLGKPNSNYKPDLANENSILFPRNTGIKDATLLLLKEKNGRFMLVKDPMHLGNCVISTDPESCEIIEVQDYTTKEAYFFKADTLKESNDWLRQLRYHAKDLGTWRKRRNALANIMINGMVR
ncbi:uncharacterized protein LOC106466179 isoform X2 [Limulus polyphemus]|uniref:Uncharacterized protein LOC106466179 isoform X2 n=1 Tax=Limulus polyphemus TaxID=6850 RepID=A0ABM1T1U4_LIMPO|nr:uncharacterized protein LOC106466179 isoform X2 [Limulus polyphemus]